MDADDLLVALESGALEVHYQPIVVMPARQVIGFEALARLRGPDGLLPPADFIPVAEHSGLIVRLGHDVLCQAVAAAASWRSEHSQLATATVSVNVAPAQLERSAIVQEITEVLQQHDVPASALVLEVTESTAASPTVRETIARLTAVGVRIAIDDFGTGFATLDTLRRMPSHVLKIDRSFVRGVTQEGADRAIVKAVTDLADNLGKSVVAEGVETEDQVQALTRLGCAVMQGFLFARPGPDPRAAAASVAAGATGSLAPSERAAGLDCWPIELDEAVLASARLLAEDDGLRRGATYAVATELARAAALSAQMVWAVGRLALVHDLARLVVDGRTPAALGADDRLLSLTEPIGSVRIEVEIVRAAVAVVDRAVATHSLATPDGLADALMREAEEHTGQLADVLARVADHPVHVVPFGELLEDLDRRRLGRRGMEERMRSVFGITRVLRSKRDTSELMRLALEEARRLVGAASASVERWEREEDQLRCLVSVGSLGAGEETFPVDEVYALADFAQARRTMHTGLPYIHRVDDPTADDDAVALLDSLGKYSSAAVPVYVDSQIWGQLWFSTDYGEPPFEARDIEILMGVATLMGGVVVQAENLHEVDRLAFEDALTRVGNRRLVDDVLEQLAARGEPTALVLLDIDWLKQINDTQGHGAGDIAIQMVADVLSATLSTRPEATIGRLGGDEFCVLLPKCSGSEAGQLARRAATQLRRQDGPSISFGVADTDDITRLDEDRWLPRELLAAADEELYRSKRARHARGWSGTGRDRTEQSRGRRRLA